MFSFVHYFVEPYLAENIFWITFSSISSLPHEGMGKLCSQGIVIGLLRHHQVFSFPDNNIMCLSGKCLLQMITITFLWCLEVPCGLVVLRSLLSGSWGKRPPYEGTEILIPILTTPPAEGCVRHISRCALILIYLHLYVMHIRVFCCIWCTPEVALPEFAIGRIRSV